MTPLGQAAIALGAKRLRVFPCKWRGKEPAIKDNLRCAAIDPLIIEKWWGAEGRWNVAIATGRASGVWVLDIDGEEGEQTLVRLIAEHEGLPPTIEVSTGKGRHLYWAWPSGVEIRNAQHRDDLPSLDWRGEGGYVLAPPSIHPSGRVYAWSSNGVNAFASAPQWLIEIVTGRSPKRSNGGPDDEAEAPAPTPPEAWARLMDQTHEGSHRASAIARFSGMLLRKYLDPGVAFRLAKWLDDRCCYPPLGHNETLRIFLDIAEREADRRGKQ